MILCGDQLEYELEHADTPPRERSDWPLPSFDAKDWAEAFCKHFPEMDEGLMIAWFSCALMRGYDEAMSKTNIHEPKACTAHQEVEIKETAVAEGDHEGLTLGDFTSPGSPAPQTG